MENTTRYTAHYFEQYFDVHTIPVIGGDVDFNATIFCL